MKKIICILVIFSSPLLQACVPTAFVAGAAAGGSVIYDNRSMKTMVEDRQITDVSQMKIDTNEKLRAKTHISVVSFNHIVLAVGQARNEELRDLAISLIQHVPKVKRIYNEITIEEPISVLKRSNDSWLTMKIKAKLLAEKGLHSTQLKVVTENASVYLMGLVSRSQGELAASVTKKVAGVQRVIKIFEYMN